MTNPFDRNANVEVYCEGGKAFLRAKEQIIKDSLLDERIEKLKHLTPNELAKYDPYDD
jgi:hypothetical protein